MTYALHATCPTWARPTFTDGLPDKLPEGCDALRWTAPFDPPQLGALIRVRMNSIGPAVVTGYFEEGGYLGVRCTLLEPPAWHQSQNSDRPGAEHSGHVFGAEIEPLEAPAADLGAVTLTWRDHDDGPAFRVYTFAPAEGQPLSALHAAYEAVLKASGFTHDPHHAAQVACKYQQGAARAFALAARLRLAGFDVTHAGCYGPTGPQAQGASA